MQIRFFRVVILLHINCDVYMNIIYTGLEVKLIGSSVLDENTVGHEGHGFCSVVQEPLALQPAMECLGSSELLAS